MAEQTKTTSTSSAGKPTEASPPSGETGSSVGQDQVQKKVDQETDKGYSGYVPDETPNEHYTVEGVTAGKPTPETEKKYQP